MNKTDTQLENLELRVELLKERIYATLALLAVLLTIDTGHTSPLRALFVIAGTALSLWAASIVAAKMSYRIVMQQLETPKNYHGRLVRHSPLLLAAVFPVLMTGLAAAHIINLGLAIQLATGASLLLILGWSWLSARAMKMGGLFTIIVTGVEVAIGIGIISLKLVVGH